MAPIRGGLHHPACQTRTIINRTKARETTNDPTGALCSPDARFFERGCMRARGCRVIAELRARLPLPQPLSVQRWASLHVYATAP